MVGGAEEVGVAGDRVSGDRRGGRHPSGLVGTEEDEDVGVGDLRRVGQRQRGREQPARRQAERRSDLTRLRLETLGVVHGAGLVLGVGVGGGQERRGREGGLQRGGGVAGQALHAGPLATITLAWSCRPGTVEDVVVSRARLVRFIRSAGRPRRRQSSLIWLRTRPSSAATTTRTIVTAVEAGGRAGGRWELERRCSLMHRPCCTVRCRRSTASPRRPTTRGMRPPHRQQPLGSARSSSSAGRATAL